jgi:cytoskeletal protein RodZ
MNMEEPLQTLTANEEANIVTSDEDQTLIAPRFDDEETLVARPVVPLEAVEDAARHDATSTREYAPRAARRSSWPLSLMLASVLIGGVLGGAGLYFYQRHSSDDGAAATASSQSETSADSSRPTQAPATGATSPASGARTEDPTTNARADDAVPAAEGHAEQPAPDSVVAAPDSADTGAARAREAENVPAVEGRDATDEERTTSAASKRGKKGEHDEEINRTGRRANRTDSGGPISRADGHNDEREARRVDTIVYRPRRASRPDRTRRETPNDADRLRRIFEGAPE